MRQIPRLMTALLLGAAVALSAPAQAQRGWGGGWGGGWGDARQAQGPTEGHVDASRLGADGAAARLGHGPMLVIAAPEASGNAPASDERVTITPLPGDLSARDQSVYQAAVVDALARAGYQIAVPLSARIDPQTGQAIPDPAQNAPGQIAEVRLSRDIAVPPEPPHKPVSGEMSMGVSTYGSGMGFGLNIDLSKPRKAMIATQIAVRIRDAASGAALWEGRAEIITREGNTRWNDNAIAGALAKGLFAGFPGTR